MRPEGNPLDLNNLPEDFACRDGKQASDHEDSSSSTGSYRKKKSGAKEGKDEPGKVYECRFCSLKFCKSQALGGHMNRHRQERETETLNKARQLVFTNDLVPGHLGFVSGGRGRFPPSGDNPPLPFRSMYPPRLFPIPPPPPSPRTESAPYAYASPPRVLSFHSQYPVAGAPPWQVGDYFPGHAIPNSGYGSSVAPAESNSYTCIGAPVGHGGGREPTTMTTTLHNQDQEVLNWGRR